MNVPGIVYVNDRLQGLLFEELQAACQRGDHGGFLPAVKQIANVAALPGVVSVRFSHLYMVICITHQILWQMYLCSTIISLKYFMYITANKFYCLFFFLTALCSTA